jgi:hypothetical protein
MSRSHKKTIYEALGREPVHPFPARMAPGIALDVVANAGTKLRVLDPMMGSGTVLALARAKGHKAIGVDIDPLAVLISRVWTTALDVTMTRECAADVLSHARQLSESLTVDQAYPAGADAETRAFLRYWFDGRNRRQLASLAAVISQVHSRTTRDALWVALSRLIITKQAGASRAMDLSHSRPHRAFKVAPIRPFDRFMTAVKRVVDNCIDRTWSGRGPVPTFHEGDARNLPLDDASIDLVLTSPPYLNAIDYMRCSKFSLVWMGYRIERLRQLRSESIGSEAGSRVEVDAIVQDIVGAIRMSPKLSQRDAAIFSRYVGDMQQSVREAARVLATGGRAVYVVGENTVRGTFIRNADVMIKVAAYNGLRLDTRRARALPANRRYLPPPSVGGNSPGLASRMRREVVLSFVKC